MATEVGKTDCANCFLLISLILKRGRGILLATVDSTLDVDEDANEDGADELHDVLLLLSTAVVGKVVNISFLNFKLGRMSPEALPAAVVGVVELSVENFG